MTSITTVEQAMNGREGMKTMTMRGVWLGGAAAMVLGAAASAASAQAQGSTTAQAPASTTALGEVVVTARRRAENLQNVPVAVTAFSAETLEQKHVTDKTALADFTPSLITITGGYPSEFAYFALRGQGPAFGSVPGVVPYFSEVANPIGIDGRTGTYFDLANVQVLAGPQGTLFGKNATGGNILFEPQAPTNRFEGYIRGEYGNYNDHRADGAINIPIVRDRVLLRLAGEVDRQDGYTTDVGPFFLGKKYDNINVDSFRGSLTLRPTDKFELETIGRYYYSNNNGPGTILEQLNPAIVAAYGAFFPGLANALADQQSRGIRHVSYDLNEFSKTVYWQILNHATYSFNDNLQFKNIISYSQFRDYYGYDYDATHFSLGGQSSRDFPVLAPNYFTEEARLEGKALGGALNFTAGVYYDNQTWHAPAGIEQYTAIPIVLFLGPIQAFAVQTNDSHAVFGQATLDLGKEIEALKGLSITGGLRYTWEHSFTSIEIIAPPAVGGAVDSRYPSYTFNIDKAFGQAAHVYLAVRDAYKSGGANGGVPATSPFATFLPERIQDVELGVKTQFEVGGIAARLNADAYRGDYTNIQRTTQQLISGVVLNVDENAAKAVVQGVEFTGAVVPVRGLTLSA
ncbi:MAG TPA: TonB-dependent receptor plug domain-containing protein, partial [Caulobacteraceae bacterium]